MKKLLYRLANRILVAACRKEYRLFWKDVQDIGQAQENVLMSIVSANTQSLFGRKHVFSQINSTVKFQEQVPLSSYDDYLPYIEKICEGGSSVLTAEPVLLLEPSSGSTSASKLVPYTKKLKDEFQRGISPWIYDLYTRTPGMLTGKAYWSITPVNDERTSTKGGTPVGFEEDGQYLGFTEQWLLSFLSAVPKEVKDIGDMNVFRYVTLLFLFKEKDLTLISVWNPSFFTLLLKPAREWMKGLLKDLETGTIQAPGKLVPELKALLENKLKANPKRAGELRKITASIYKHDNSPCEPVSGFSGRKFSLFEAIWPNLKLISCWTDANAKTGAEELQALFPNVKIQGKGLLATEGFISFPLVGEEGAVLSVRSHFFEFIEYFSKENAPLEEAVTSQDAPSEVVSFEVAASKAIKLAHQIEEGKVYSVVITTGGGFYRYRLYDLVQVVGFTKGCPRVRFVGREKLISDCCGEKLNEIHVRQVMEIVLQSRHIIPNFCMIAPEAGDKGTFFYVLYLEVADRIINRDDLIAIAGEVEEGLLENYHYSYCRKLGQLDRLRLFLIRGEKELTGMEIYHRVCLALGLKAGDIKPVSLHPKSGWVKEFPGAFIDE